MKLSGFALSAAVGEGVQSGKTNQFLGQICDITEIKNSLSKYNIKLNHAIP